MHPATRTDAHAGTLAVAVLGTDAVLAGLPATAVQLAHACLRGGYDLAVPASWGDELVAAECLRTLDARGPRPAVICTCPLVRRELLAVGTDLAPLLLSVVPPPVAVARYVRALFTDNHVLVTFIGACPGGEHAEIDARIEPEAFLAMLAEQGIALADQPTAFDSVLPPDRRRYFSVPGGAPTPAHLWNAVYARAFVELDGDLPRMELAQRLLSRECALIDIAPRLGCVCSGAVPGVPARRARPAAAALEPPRASSTVIDTSLTVELAAPICTRDRDDVAADPVRDQAERAVALSAPRVPSTVVRRRSPASGVRAITGAMPVARVAGRSLPRAYVSRRRVNVPDVATGSGETNRSEPEAAIDRTTSGRNGRKESRSRRASVPAQPAGSPPPVVATPRSRGGARDRPAS